MQQPAVELILTREVEVDIDLLAFCRCDTKTKDNVFVQIVVSVQYQVRRLLRTHRFSCRMSHCRGRVVSSTTA